MLWNFCVPSITQKKLFRIILLSQQFFCGNLLLISKKNDISGGPKLELITDYHLGFVIKFLWKILWM